jgi:GDP-D-mannose dehydratase
MNILITGISGFVGYNFTDYILKNVPEANIFAIRRWKSSDENIKHLYTNEKVRFIEADLLDRGSLENIIRIAIPSYVFHFAAQSYPMSSFNTPIHTLNTNVIGTVNLLDELRIARDRKICDPIIVSVSSSEVYGNPLPEEIPIKESNPIRAANPYSISKVAHDLMSQFYYQAYGLKVIITRMFSHEGSRRGKLFALSSFAYQIVQAEKLYRERLVKNCNECFDLKYKVKVGNLNSIRTYSHVDDAVNAYWLAATKGKIGNVYNIGGTDTCTVGDALNKLLLYSLVPINEFNIVVDPNKIRLTDITLQVPCADKFKQDTGWEPKKHLDDICNDLLQFWRKNIKE